MIQWWLWHNVSLYPPALVLQLLGCNFVGLQPVKIKRFWQIALSVSSGKDIPAARHTLRKIRFFCFDYWCIYDECHEELHLSLTHSITIHLQQCCSCAVCIVMYCVCWRERESAGAVIYNPCSVLVNHTWVCALLKRPASWQRLPFINDRALPPSETQPWLLLSPSLCHCMGFTLIFVFTSLSLFLFVAVFILLLVYFPIYSHLANSQLLCPQRNI